MNSIKVTKKQVAPIVKATFPGYTGRTFRVEFVENVNIYNTNWDGGSKNDYMAVEMSSGKIGDLPRFSPWNNPVEGKDIPLTEDTVVVCHSYFCGQDMGITIYAHPSRAKMITG